MSIKNKIAILLRGYKVLHGLIPGYLPAAAARAIFSALLPFVNIVASAMIINALSERREFTHVLTLAIVAALINLGAQAAMHALKGVSSYLSVNVRNIYEQPLNEKQQEMDFEQIENPETHFLRQKIHTYRNTSGQGVSQLYWSFENTVTHLFTILFSIGVFASAFTVVGTKSGGFWDFINTPWCGVLFALMVVGNAVLNILLISRSTKKIYAVLGGFHFPNMIGQFFYDKLFNKYQMGKDIMIYKLSRNIRNVIDGIIDATDPIIENWSALETRYASYGDLSSNILSALVYIFVAVKAVLGGLGVGSIVQYVGGITQFNTGLAGFASRVAELFANVEALKLYFEFLDMPDKLYHGTLPVEKRHDNEYEIEFHNVSFKYPGKDVYALKRLNMKFNIGQRMAVVGMNGSGKTTMIKLLCRLYDPTEGEITLNGIDIQKYRYDEYMDIFSVVFQDFKLFSFSLGQNVAANMAVDETKALDSLHKAGLAGRLSTMPEGLDTPLYKDFEEDGVEISGGEAQKIALARALYKDAPFIVLDEPTAALDPIAEFEIYSKFNEMVGDKTAIYISHRLSSCRFCDDIAVFHEGELIQRGSHDALIADKDGKYYELWNAQAQYYDDGAA